MSVSVRIQQPPLPLYAISSPLALNYCASPHATLSNGLWAGLSSTLSDPTLRTEEAEQYLRFTRTATGPALIAVDDARLQLPSGTFDVLLSTRSSIAETGATLGLRLGDSQADGDQHMGSAFSTTGAWVEQKATLTITAANNWTLVLKLATGTVGSLIDVKLASIMPTGIAPFTGDQIPAEGSTDFYYWQGPTNASPSIHATRTLTNTPGPAYQTDNLTTYSITEYATPLTPADTTGGATTVQLGVEEFDDSKLLEGGELTLLENGQPVVQGFITAPTSDGSTVSVTSLSIVARLNVVKKVAPFNGSLDQYIATLLASVGVTRPLNVDLEVAQRTVAVPGFNDNVLSKLKEFCSAQGIELSDKGDAAYVRIPRQRMLGELDFTETGWSSDNSQMAQSVEVFNYNSDYYENALIYPPATYDDSTGTTSDAGWTMDTEILTVDAGSVTIYEVDIAGSLFSVEQPTCVKSVGPTDGAAGGVYTVIGQGSVDGSASIETLDPAEWEKLGGSVTVRVGDNYDTIVITIASGANEPSLAPFAIAMNAGDSTFYSSLRIRGTGILNKKEKLTYPTGVSADETPNDVGQSIDSQFIQSRQMADRVAWETIPMYASPVQTITGTTGDTGEGIGDIAGSRIHLGNAVYRITQAATSEAGVTITATSDTTLDDFDALWETASFDDFDAVWQDHSFLQFGAAPLLDA